MHLQPNLWNLKAVVHADQTSQISYNSHRKSKDDKVQHAPVSFPLLAPQVALVLMMISNKLHED